MSGFRIWPNEIGCRRQRLDSLTLSIVPCKQAFLIRKYVFKGLKQRATADFEAHLLCLPRGFRKQSSWRRRLSSTSTIAKSDNPLAPNAGSWTQVKACTKCFVAFGADFEDLVAIVDEYQRGHKRPVRILPCARAGCFRCMR